MVVKKILVPLDGSERSEAVLPHVQIIAHRTRAQVILVRVIPFFWPADIVQTEEIREQMEKEVSDYLFSLQVRLGEKGIEGNFWVGRGNVPEVICEFARERSVDLIAMSTHGRGGLSRWAIGSVADKVVHIASVPIFLCPSSQEKVPDGAIYKNILVPIDGSLFAENIFSYVKDMVELFKAKVWFLYVLDLHSLESFKTLGSFIEQKDMEWVKTYVSGLEGKLNAAGAAHYEFCIKKGNPAEEICNFSTERNIDLIAMSTHGRSGISRWALGSVADKVIQTSTKPVLLVRSEE